MLASVAVGCFQPVTELELTHDFVVGPSGGRFDLDGGVSLFFPVGAVTEPRSIKVTRIATSVYVPGAPLGDAWLFEPEGESFNQLVQVTVPMNAAVPLAARVRVARAPNKSRFFELLFPTRTVDALRVNTSHFSVFIAVAISEDGGVPELSDGGALDAGFLKPDAGSDRDAGAKSDAG